MANRQTAKVWQDREGLGVAECRCKMGVWRRDAKQQWLVAWAVARDSLRYKYGYDSTDAYHLCTTAHLSLTWLLHMQHAHYYTSASCLVSHP